jgi:hypothetical protein
MPSLDIKVTSRIKELIDNGVIVVTFAFYETGVESYCRVVQPHPKIGVYPHDSLTLDEAQVLLEKVVFTKDVTTRVESASASKGKEIHHDDELPHAPSPSGVKRGQAVRIDHRNITDVGRVPVAIELNKVRNALPINTLTWKDLLYLSDGQLNQRLKYLGTNITSEKAVSRIVTGSFGPRSSNLKSWWMKASYADRFRVLTNAKKAGERPTNADELLSRLTGGRYPFRGTDPPLAMEESEDEESLEEEFDGLNLDFDDYD